MKRLRVKKDRVQVISEPMCGLCLHFWGLDSCTAFPEGIPEEILHGPNNHKEPYPGDHGLRFTQV